MTNIFCTYKKDIKIICYMLTNSITQEEYVVSRQKHLYKLNLVCISNLNSLKQDMNNYIYVEHKMNDNIIIVPYIFVDKKQKDSFDFILII